jgi:SAM-dependent methyltransferase
VRAELRRLAGAARRRLRPAPPSVREQVGLRLLEPVSRQFGADRGRPVDRFYIERFLAGRSQDVRGRVLEIYEDTYTQWYGAGRVTRSDVLHKGEHNPAATLYGDLATGEGLGPELEGAFDCFILTQTLLLVWDVPAALATARRLLRPGGVLLVSVPGISQVSLSDRAEHGDWWRFTSGGLRRLLEDAFPGGEVAVEAHGNVLAASAFLYGLAVEDLSEAELAHRDPAYELLVTARVVAR